MTQEKNKSKVALWRVEFYRSSGADKPMVLVRSEICYSEIEADQLVEDEGTHNNLYEQVVIVKVQ